MLAWVFLEHPPEMGFVMRNVSVSCHGFKPWYNLQWFLWDDWCKRRHHDTCKYCSLSAAYSLTRDNFQKDKFPNGFYIVFVAKGSDYDCTGNLKQSSLDRNKNLWFSINPSISYHDYVNAVLATLGCIGAFYVVFGLGFFFCSRRGYRPRAMQYVEESDFVGTPTTVNSKCVWF